MDVLKNERKIKVFSMIELLIFSINNTFFFFFFEKVHKQYLTIIFSPIFSFCNCLTSYYHYCSPLKLSKIVNFLDDKSYIVKNSKPYD